ncbi:glycosyltransferase family 2 protein [Pseudomonas sihuiensis]|uniref:Glycosyltransferase involved in cell wall bisynthesis n=1 Tax=Pseudomonas sihuiensis TaxID=1274359 RepID=A0A1H2L8Y9_9PSED|nr:glycosyltransferase family 2 protein [Pseudomonas sihuiensis]SDU77500.1 Glycosyltransferase involved in cell wall bisynthesis [Pseudomonas sihuiensis]
MFHPEVTVVMPVYNAEKTVLASIDSVLEQTFPSLELIVVDDCSSDTSYELIRSRQRADKRVKLLRLDKNSGAAQARNKAISEAQGRFIAFLDCDDLWRPEKLKEQLHFMRDRDVAFSYTAYERIDESGNVMGIISAPEKLAYQDLLKTNYIGCLSVMYDTLKLGKVYMSLNSGREDFATWLQVLKDIKYVYGLNLVLAQYRVHSSQSSAKKTKMAVETWRLYRNVEHLSLIRAFYFFSHYALRGLLRSSAPRLMRFFFISR